MYWEDGKNWKWMLISDFSTVLFLMCVCALNKLICLISSVHNVYLLTNFFPQRMFWKYMVKIDYANRFYFRFTNGLVFLLARLDDLINYFARKSGNVIQQYNIANIVIGICMNIQLLLMKWLIAMIYMQWYIYHFWYRFNFETSFKGINNIYVYDVGVSQTLKINEKNDENND